MRHYHKQPSGTIDRARQLRRDSTKPENLLWRALRESFPDHKWRRQMPVGPYFADIACFTARLIVEADGGQHAASSSYDEARTRFLQAQGYRVLRFWNNEILENMDGVITTIIAAMSPSPSQPSAGPLPLPLGEGV